MDGVTLIDILSDQNLSIPFDDVLGVLLKQVEYSDIELFVPLDRISIMEDLRGQMSVLNVHVFKSIPTLFPKKLVVQCLLKVDSLQVEQCDHAIVVSAVAKTMVCVPV